MSSRATIPEYQPLSDAKALVPYVTLCLLHRVTKRARAFVSPRGWYSGMSSSKPCDICLHFCLTLRLYHNVYTVASPCVCIMMSTLCCLTLSIHYVYTVSSPWVCPLWRSSWVGKTYSSFFSPLVPKDSSSAHAPKKTLLGGSKPGKQKTWVLYFLSGAFV